MFSSKYKVKVLLEAFDDNLRNQISQRLANQERFQEADLMTIINVASRALIELRDTNFPHFNINPETILIASGKYKLYHPGILSVSDNNISNAKRGIKSYTSPEMFKQLRFPKLFIQVDSHLSDTFSLGLTVLEAATLEPEKTFYKGEGNLDEGCIRKKVRKVADYYSTELVNLLVRMLIVAPEDRIDL